MNKRSQERFLGNQKSNAMRKAGKNTRVGSDSTFDLLRNLERELAELQVLFPESSNLSFDRSYAERIISGEIKLPQGATKWALIFNWEKFFRSSEESIQSSIFAVGSIQEAIGGQLYTDSDSEPEVKLLKTSARTKFALHQLDLRQKGFIYIIPIRISPPCQVGDYNGIGKLMGHNEFGLGVCTTAGLMLAQSFGTKKRKGLYVDCAGDENAVTGENPFFFFHGKDIWFYTSQSRSTGSFGGYYTRITGFVVE